MTLPTIIAGLHYSRVLPHATYSPWLDDSEFRKVYDQIRANTLVDEYRCFELWQLVHHVRLVEGDIIEVGVWRGGTGALLASKSQICSPNKTVCLCDTFAGVVKASDKDPVYKGGEHANTSEKIVDELLGRVGLSNAKVLKGIFPDQTGDAVTSARFSLAHIDVDVYESAQDIMAFVWPRLSVGGVVVFDDYGFLRCGGIARLVDGYRDDRDKLVIHNLNGHGIVVNLSSS